MGVSPPRSRVSPLVVLSVRPYRFLWSAQVVSQLGDACAGVALIYLVSRLSGDPLTIGLVVFCMLLPAALVGPFAGVLADRFPPRHLMVAADLYRVVVVATMIPAARAESIPALLALVFLAGVGSAFFSPARAALVPRLVGRDKVPAAVGLSQATAATVTVLGPGLGGLLLMWMSVEAVLALDAATFLVSALLLLGARVAEPERVAASPAKAPYLAALGEGFKVLVRHPALLAVLGVLGIFSMMCGILNASQAAVLLQEFGLSATQYGSAQAAQGLGSIGGALLAPALIATVGAAGALFAGAGLMGAAMAAVSLVAGWLAVGVGAPVYAWAALLGVAVSLVTVTAQTLFMTLAPPQVLGRIAATMQAATNLANVAGILGGGVLAGLFGASAVMSWAGGVAVVLSLAGLVSPIGRSMSRGEQEATAVKARPVQAATTAALPSAPPPRHWVLVSDPRTYQALASVDVFRVLSALEACPGGVEELASTLGRPQEEVRVQLDTLLAAGLVETVPEGPSTPGQRGGAAPPAETDVAALKYRPATRALRLSPEVLGREGVQRIIELTVLPGLVELRRLVREPGAGRPVHLNS
ncbi:MAG TPA: hypothetical protein DHW14_02765 [Clostridiales bacterium]|nr:hypothetical protein [Clostridiales bacterium]